MITYRRVRHAFTLVELLTVMALIAILATMMMVFLPGAATSQREARAAQMLQGWLNVAKQRALRDQAPRGLRLNVTQGPFAGVTLSNIVTDCQYIEQPDDYNSGPIQSGPPNLTASSFNALNSIIFNSADLLNGNYPYNAADVAFWAVQPGDYLELFGTGLIYTVNTMGVDNNGKCYIGISPPLPNALTTATNSYRILRAPRAVGSDPLHLPGGTVVDLNTNLAFGYPLPPTPVGTTAVDILFSPGGAVITRGLATSNILLWVRAPSGDAAQVLNAFYGQPTIVSVSNRTGFVGAYPPASTSNPYGNVQ